MVRYFYGVSCEVKYGKLSLSSGEKRMAREEKHFIDENDIGSGEPNPGQEDVQRDVEAVKAAQAGKTEDGHRLQQVVDEQRHIREESSEIRPPMDERPSEERIMQSGTHLARIATQAMSDGTFEAQVYVRLAREPQIAETYIPTGKFATEDEAWRAAEQRARRALDQHEF